jgi:sulfoxide reductase heme-binding subunit YedZ
MIYLTAFVTVFIFFVSRDFFLMVSGYLAFAFLVASLAVSPLRRLGFKIKPKFRKQLGVCSGIIALSHSIFAITIVFNFKWEVMFDLNQAYTGLTVLSIYLFLLVTSFKFMQKLLKTPSWKNLHKIVYVLPFFILIHSYYSSNEFISYNILQTAIFIVLMLSKLLPKKKTETSDEQLTQSEKAES